jgi:DNA polymerase III delta subunit
VNYSAPKTDTNYAVHLSNLVKSEPKHGYLLLGNSEYLKNLLVTTIRKKLSTTFSLDFQTMFGDELETKKLVDFMSTNNFFYTGRILLVRRFFSLPKKVAKELTTQNLFVNIPEDTFILIEDEGISRDYALVKKLFPSFHILEDTTLDPKLFTAWIKKRFEANKISPTQQQIDIFSKTCGYDLDFAIAGIDRIAMQYKGGDLDWEEINKRYLREQNDIIFALSDVIMQNKPDKALMILGNLIRQGKSTEELFYYLLNHFQFLIQVKLTAIDYKDKGNTAEAMHGQNRYRVEKGFDQVRSISIQKLQEVFKELVIIDMNIKSGVELDLSNSLTLWVGKPRL